MDRSVMQVHLLGPFRVTCASDELSIRGRLQRTLLARLALAQGIPIPTHTLVYDLWPDEPPRNPVHALQAQISRLRATVPVPIQHVDGAYRFPHGTITTDVERFERLCEDARRLLDSDRADEATAVFDRAFALWPGTIPSHVQEVPGLRPFIVNLAETRRAAAANRIDAYLRSGRGQEVVGELRTSLETDPLQERSWYQLMQALHGTGRPKEALEAYQDARTMFITELGTEPSERLSELHADILAGSASAAETGYAARSIREPIADPVRVIGRERDWDVLRRTFEDSSGALDVITLSGEAGIGKTKLAMEFARQVEAAGVTVLRGHCRDADPRPYEPFTSMVRESLNADPPRLVPEFPKDTADVRAREAVIAWLEALCERGRILLVIEDIHLADAATVGLLHELIRRPHDIDALLILTIRDEVLQRDGEEATGLLATITQSDTVTHLPLRLLDAAEADALIADEMQRAMRQSPPAWLRDYVGRVAGGNPLFIVELTRHLSRFDEQDVPQSAGVPVGLQQVVLANIHGLAKPVASVLSKAAVIGVEFSVHTLADITEYSAAEVDDAVREGIRARLIEPLPDASGVCSFTHDIIRTVLYDSVPFLERAQLHGRIARALEQRPGRPADHYALLAHHFGRSDHTEAATTAAEYARLAGREALRRDAPADAVTHFREAVGYLERADARCDALIELGVAQMQAAQPQYRETLLAAARGAMELEDPRRLSAAVLANSRGWWSSAVGIDYERLETIETALAWCEEHDRGTRALLLGAWAVESVCDPAARECVLARSAEGISLAEGSGDDTVLATALTQRHTVLFALFEEVEECVGLNERLLELSQRMGDRSLRLSASIGLAQTTMRMGRFATADRFLEQSAQLAQTLNHPHRLWLVRGWQAMRELGRGRLERAEELMRHTYEFGRAIGSVTPLPGSPVNASPCPSSRVASLISSPRSAHTCPRWLMPSPPGAPRWLWRWRRPAVGMRPRRSSTISPLMHLLAYRKTCCGSTVFATSRPPVRCSTNETPRKHYFACSCRTGAWWPRTERSMPGPSTSTSVCSRQRWGTMRQHANILRLLRLSAGGSVRPFG